MLEAGEQVLRRAGFEVVRREDLLARRGYLAGDDLRRAAELRELFERPDVDGILCVRGGYGCDRILGSLDPEVARAARKPVVGYSDATALLLWLRRRAGLVGFHGPMLERGGDVDEGVFGRLLETLSGNTPPPLAGRGHGGGRASGRLVGGNLTMVCTSLGSPWEVDTRGAILLIEEVGERPYRIDRMLRQLLSAHKLECLAGLGVGDLGTCTDERYPEPDAESVVIEVARSLGLPLVTGLPFGHVKANEAWPLGVRATIDADLGEVRIEERGVVIQS